VRQAGRFGRTSQPLLGLAVFAGALVVWEVWARAEGSFLVPAISDVLVRAWEVWPSADFRHQVAESMRRLAAGFAIGAGLGIAIGLVMGSSLAVRRTLDPLVELLRATPPIALVPALIVVLGFGDSMRIAVIALGVCFPVLVNTLEGVRGVPPEMHDTASMLHLGRIARVFRINLPAALPSIAAGLRIAISIGLVLVVISEFAGQGGGLGHYILDAQGRFDVSALYAAILFLGLLGYALNGSFLLLERRVLAWHRGAVGGQAR
jgi:ABC-type nitrate/sulfonate/bicarbonate transport system permease component